MNPPINIIPAELDVEDLGGEVFGLYEELYMLVNTLSLANDNDVTQVIKDLIFSKVKEIKANEQTGE